MDYSEPIPFVQKKKKQVSFKITMIGGPDEIKKWREMQAAKINALNLRLIDRDARIERYEIEISEKLSEPELNREAWHDKVSRVLTERKETAERIKKAIEYKPWQPVIHERTAWQRLSGWVSSTWRNITGVN